MTRNATEKIMRTVRAGVTFAAIEVLGRFLYYAGILYAIGTIRKYFGRPRLVVPMYHRVNPPQRPEQLAVLGIEDGIPAELLRQHLRVMSWFGRFLPLREAYDHLCAAARPRTVIALTFDDGYRDNLAHALPILRRRRVSATVFPVIRVLDGGRPLWWDELSHIIRNGRLDNAGLIPYINDVPELTPSPSDASALGTQDKRPAMAEFICNRLLPLPMQRRKEVLNLLAQRLDVSTFDLHFTQLYMDWSGLREMIAAGWEVGGHTVEHPVLTAEERLTRVQEIAGCRRSLENKLTVRMQSFCYPNGQFDVGDTEVVRQVGFKLAVTVQPGVNYQTTDRYRLKRVPLGAERPFHLAMKLAFYGLVHR